jgi:hypothetical protein
VRRRLIESRDPEHFSTALLRVPLDAFDASSIVIPATRKAPHPPPPGKSREEVGAVQAKIFYDWSFFALDPKKSIQTLNKGDVLFMFKAVTGANLTAADTREFLYLTNLSSYEDEQLTNKVPAIDLTDATQNKLYSLLLSKVMYLLPGFDSRDISPEHWASQVFFDDCQAGRVAWIDPKEGIDMDVHPEELRTTFRFYKTLIPFVFKLLIQMKVSVVTEPAALEELGQIAGFQPDRALLLERTKHHRDVVDGTAKAKSVLLFRAVPGGTLVCHYVIVLNTALPGIVATLLNNFSGPGAAEAAESIERTRYHLKKVFGDSRAPAATTPAVAAPAEE